MQIFCFIFNGSDWINTPRGNYVRQPGGRGGKMFSMILSGTRFGNNETVEEL